MWRGSAWPSELRYWNDVPWFFPAPPVLYAPVRRPYLRYCNHREIVCCELVRVWRRLWALCTFVNVRRGSIGTVWYSPLRKHTPLNVPIRGSVTRSRCAAALRRLRCGLRGLPALRRRPP
jgi:hypothetical protein